MIVNVIKIIWLLTAVRYNKCFREIDNFLGEIFTKNLSDIVYYVK